MMLHFNFTIETWIKYLGGQNIFSTSRTPSSSVGAEDLFNFSTQSPDRLVAVWQELSRVSYTDTEASFTNNRWSYVAIASAYDNAAKLTTFSFYRSGVVTSTSSVAWPLMDSYNYRHLLGAEMNT